MIKTSIIVPVYNTAAYLYDCFNSIFNQTQKEIEVIAVNDGSTDDSLSILEKIKKEHPNMIIVSQENKRQGAARNRGVECATGEFIYFMDSDDCLADNAMEMCYQCAKDNKLDVVMFDAKTFGNIRHDKKYYDRTSIIQEPNIVLSGTEFANKYWLERFLPSPCLLYISAQFIKKNNLKFLTGIYYEDNEYYCKLIPLAERIMYIPCFLFFRRYREASTTTSSFDMKHAEDYLQMIRAVDQLEYSNSMSLTMQKMKLLFLNDLAEKGVRNNLFEDDCFAHSFWETATNMCGGNIEDVSTFQDIEMLYQVSSVVSDAVVSQKMKRRITDRKKKILEELFAEIPLREKDKYVGIYGIGRNTDRFLQEYQKNLGSISAKVIFIESISTIGRNKYNGYSVYNVDDIEDIPFACIVVASSKYEKEIYQTLKEKYGNRYKCIRLMSDLKF